MSLQPVLVIEKQTFLFRSHLRSFCTGHVLHQQNYSKCSNVLMLKLFYSTLKSLFPYDQLIFPGINYYMKHLLFHLNG